MVNVGYHKGEVCILDFLLCQEGYCANCMIFAEKIRSGMSIAKVPAGGYQELHSGHLNLCVAKS
jgi:hypothetical protein